MIGLIYNVKAPLRPNGGADRIASLVLESLQPLDDILIIPTLDLISHNNKDEICQSISNLENKYIISRSLKNFCKDNTTTSVESLMVNLIHEIKSSHLKLLLDPYPYVYIKKPSRALDYLSIFRKDINEAFCDRDALIFPAWCLSKKSYVPLIVLWQHGARAWRCIPRVVANMIRLGIPGSYYIPAFRFIFDKLIKTFQSELVKLVLSVGWGPVKVLGLSNCKKARVLYPGVVIDVPGEIGKSRKDKENYLIYLSRLEPAKGLFDIIYIMRALKNVDKFTKLILVGGFKDIKTKEKFERLAEKFHVKDRIIYTGPVDENTKFSLLSRARALVFPTHIDNFPLVILESLIVGTPVLTYNIPGPKEAYRNVEGVYFIKEFDFNQMVHKITRLVGESELNDSVTYSDKTLKFIRDHTNKELFKKNILEQISSFL